MSDHPSPRTTRLKVGLIGPGAAGAVHASAVRAAGADLTWVLGSSPQRTLSAARASGARPAQDLDQLVAGVDVVHVCSPEGTHAAYAREAIAAGRHVVCEVPLGLAPGEAQELAAAAQAAQVVATVAFVARFYPMVRLARRRVRSGQVGPIHLLRGERLQDGPSWEGQRQRRAARGQQSRADAMVVLGSHWWDLVEFVSGHRVCSVHASLLTSVPEGADGGGAVLFRTDRGALGSVVISRASPGSQDVLRLTLEGAEEGLFFDQERPDRLEIGHRDKVQVLRRGGEISRYSPLGPGRPQGYQQCVDAFVADTYAAVAGGTPDGLPTFADGVRAAEVTAAALLSHATRSWVDLDPGSFVHDAGYPSAVQPAAAHP